MTVQTMRIVHTPTISVPDVFHVPKLSFNLLSVGQLCELGYRLVFDFSGVYVQDPRTSQTLGTRRRVGQLFELSSLYFPSLVSLLLPLHHRHLLLFGIRVLVMHLCLGYKF
jgi:hypothetical protein